MLSKRRAIEILYDVPVLLKDVPVMSASMTQDTLMFVDPQITGNLIGQRFKLNLAHDSVDLKTLICASSDKPLVLSAEDQGLI